MSGVIVTSWGNFIMQLETNLAKAIYVSCLTIFLTGLGGWAVLAHQDASSPMSAQSKDEMSDGHFARQASLGGMAEIQLSKLASERGSNAAVKAFGERMVVQHGAAADQLKALAQKENIILPSKLSSHEQQIYDHLANLSGSAFDRAYARDMVQDHEKDLTDFQNEVANGKDENIKTFAATTAPMIQEHLNQARELLKTVSQTSSRATSARSSGK
jgi:putative membrane protein